MMQVYQLIAIKTKTKKKQTEYAEWRTVWLMTEFQGNNCLLFNPVRKYSIQL